MRSEEEAVLKQFVDLADQYGVQVTTAIRTGLTPAEAIVQKIRRGDHTLVVMGVSQRTGDTLSFGPMVSAVAAHCHRSIMFVSS